MTELNAQSRTIIGSHVKNLRKQGIFPAVMYGAGIESKPITTSYIDFERVFREAGESTLVTVHLEGKPYNVLIHDVAYDALRGNPIHADFFVVRMDKIIRTTVPIEFINESSAVKHDGGILVKVIHEIEVEALPKDLPHELTVDLSLLSDFESRILVQDIIIPKDVKIMAETDDIVALVEAPRSAEELEALEQTAAGEVAEVKTEQEEKRAAALKDEDSESTNE